MLEIGSEFAERARVSLKLDSSILANAVMFAQPLVIQWKPHWKYAYTIGLALAAKLDLDGFFIADIIDYVTDDFPLYILKKGERMAFEQWEKDMQDKSFDLRARRLTFRNALVHVALEAPLSGPTAVSPARCDDEDAPPPPHVLVVDDSHHARELHRALLLSCSPDAIVKTASSVTEALHICRNRDANEPPLNLILLDLNMTRGDAVTSQLLRDLIADQACGFSMAETLKRAESEEAPRIDFTSTPLIAMVTTYAGEVIKEVDQRVDGSIGPCDVILPKPLTASSVRALVETSVV